MKKLRILCFYQVNLDKKKLIDWLDNNAGQSILHQTRKMGFNAFVYFSPHAFLCDEMIIFTSDFIVKREIAKKPFKSFIYEKGKN